MVVPKLKSMQSFSTRGKRLPIHQNVSANISFLEQKI